jgi:predicted TIM-barrel enzyme
MTEWAAAERQVREDIYVLCHGDPIAEPADAQYVLDRAIGIDGFYGASSMDRLPAEKAVTDRVQKFLSTKLPHRGSQSFGRTCVTICF